MFRIHQFTCGDHIPSNYYDQQGKSGVADDPEGLKNYLINIYRILLTRGVRGTYVYVCDEELRGYLGRFLPDE